MLRGKSASAVGLALLCFATPLRAEDSPLTVYLTGQTEPTRFELTNPSRSQRIATCERWCRVEVVPGTYRLRVFGGDAVEEQVVELVLDRDTLVRARVPDGALERRGRRLRTLGLLMTAGGTLLFVGGALASIDMSGLGDLDPYGDDDCDDDFDSCDESSSSSDGGGTMILGGILAGAGLVVMMAGASKVKMSRAAPVRVYPLRAGGREKGRGPVSGLGLGLGLTASF